MSVDKGLFDWTAEALAPLGTVTIRPMMGCGTLYLDGIVFALIDEGEIWFKSDKQSDALWDAQGCERFPVDFGNGKAGTLNYRRGPTDVYDEAEAMQRCAGLALEAGARAAAKKKPKKPKQP